MKIRLDQVNLVVRDMDAMAAFYERLGLDFGRGRSPEWDPHHRGATTDGIDVDLDSEAFASVWDEGWPGGSGVVLCFRVEERDHVDELHERLTSAGYASQQAPYDAFFGARFAVVTDPDGNAVGLLSPRDPARRSPMSPPS